MDIYTQTKIEIEFAKGESYTPIVVLDGVEQESKTFSNKTHQIEELFDYIQECEYADCEVYI